MKQKVVLVALDACDWELSQRFAAAGHMPNVGRLMERSARCRVDSPYGVFVGSIWQSIATGLTADRLPNHCWDEIEVATYERVLAAPPAIGELTFWRKLSDAGRRVAVIDVPHAQASAPLNGVQIAEWGCHDRHYGYHSWPPQQAGQVEAAHGLHPILGMDAYAKRTFAPDDYIYRAGQYRTADEDAALLQGMLGGVRAKRDLTSDLLREDAWDLFVSVFGEAHAVGHQQWHLHDASHPRHDPERARVLGGDPVVQTYRELDLALGDMLRPIGDDATVLVYLSHGMGPHYDGGHLLEGVLTQLDRAERSHDGSPSGEPGGRSWRRVFRDAVVSPAVSAAERLLPYSALATVVPAVNRASGNKVWRVSPEYCGAGTRAAQRYFVEPNNYVLAGIRLNVAGREARGCIAPSEVDGVVARLREDLLSVVNVGTGRRAVRDIVRSDRFYSRSPSDTLPDLFVEWDRTAPFETVWSPKTGVVHAPYVHWRTGDHRPEGLLLASGPGIPSRAELPRIETHDLAAGIMARLGVAPEGLDGRAPKWLAA